MKIRSILSQIVLCSTAISMAVPQLAYGADNLAGRSPSMNAPVRDVALSARGNLEGKIVDSSGKPLAGSRVLVRQNGQVAAEAASDATGKFALAGVRPGVYEVATGHTTGVYRVWTQKSAPPAAIDGVLIVDDENVVRAQGRDWRRVMLVTGLIVTAGVVGGVIGYNIKDDDDAS